MLPLGIISTIEKQSLHFVLHLNLTQTMRAVVLRYNHIDFYGESGVILFSGKVSCHKFSPSVSIKICNSFPQTQTSVESRLESLLSRPSRQVTTRLRSTIFRLIDHSHFKSPICIVARVPHCVSLSSPRAICLPGENIVMILMWNIAITTYLPNLIYSEVRGRFPPFTLSAATTSILFVCSGGRLLEKLNFDFTLPSLSTASHLPQAAITSSVTKYYSFLINFHLKSSAVFLEAPPVAFLKSFQLTEIRQSSRRACLVEIRKQ